MNACGYDSSVDQTSGDEAGIGNRAETGQGGLVLDRCRNGRRSTPIRRTAANGIAQQATRQLADPSAVYALSRISLIFAASKAWVRGFCSRDTPASSRP